MSKNKKTKILVFDIETSPNISYTWGKWEQNVIEFEREWYMMTFAAKWLGQKNTYVYGLPDFETYKKDEHNDIELVSKLWEFFDEADIIIAHNGDAFDIKKTNTRFLQHGFPPPSPYKKIDTLKIARKYFKFQSNKLDDLGEYLGVGRKIDTGGFQLWLDCIKGDISAWGRMKKYNKQDIILLEDVYKKLLPYIENHPNVNSLTGKNYSCPNCSSADVQKRGFSITKTRKRQRYQCQDCGAWSQGQLEGEVLQVK